MKKKKIVALTGAGISAESGIPTFRDADGLWEGYDVMKVATPEAWRADRALVLDFYNQRRKAALEVKPNLAHHILAKLEEDFQVTIITQNIDNLHEQAGSSHIIHLHGELFKSRSTLDENLTYPIEGWALNIGDKCERGSQLRPHVVWFGEMVPMMEPAIEATATADIFMVVGTSLLVYPAAGLIDMIGADIPRFIIDPKLPTIPNRPNLHLYEEKASTGLEQVAKILKRDFMLKK